MSQSLLEKLSYKPDLDEFISQCEVNYDLILRLLPWLKADKKTRLSDLKMRNVTFHSKSGHKIDFRIAEKAAYTTTILLHVHSPSRAADADIDLMVRLYHDAQLMEVMDQVGPNALKPINSGVDLKNKQIDEKKQLNRFLGESLRYCLQSDGLQSDGL